MRIPVLRGSTHNYEILENEVMYVLRTVSPLSLSLVLRTNKQPPTTIIRVCEMESWWSVSETEQNAISL